MPAPRSTRPPPASTAQPQDDLAAQSHQRAAEAAKNGLFDDEIVAVEVPQRKGDPLVVDTDEGVRGDTTAESLGSLRPAFDKAGNITAGNASQISDGGAAVDRDLPGEGRGARRRRPWARSSATARSPAPTPRCSPSRPGPSRSRWSDRAGSVGDIALFELNEAFAAVGIASMDDLGITDEITNVNGGAIALGHPIGMSGTRLALHLLNELGRRGGGLGAAALCGGGGQGDAILLQVP